MGKSSRHKAQNVYHFVSFTERILAVNTDVIHRLRRNDDQAEDTFFGEALLKWTDLDLTDHFVSFKKEIQSQVQTYEQLVHFKDEIIASLKKHLAIPDSLALNALLDLLVQLARDIQQDFVPHFHDFFTILVNILSTHSQNAEVLEQTFQTLAFLFRFLWRYLVKDFTTVFSYFSQLLQSSEKDYIKVFAAESCAYLLRKVKQQDKLINFLLGTLKAHPGLTDGMGLLLFEMIKGVNHHFHTISEKVFPLILQKLGPWRPEGEKEVSLPFDLVENSVTLLMQECAEHTTKDHSKSLWVILMDIIGKIHAACLKSHTEEGGNSRNITSGLIQHLSRLLRLVSVWLTHNNGSIVSEPGLIVSSLCVILKSPCNLEALGKDLIKTISDLLKICHERLSVEMIFQLNSLVFAAPFKFSYLKNFLTTLQNLPFFEKDILPRLMSRLNSDLLLGDTEQKHDVLAFMAELIVSKTRTPMTGEDVNLLKAYHLDKSWSRSSGKNSFTVFVESVLADTLGKESISVSDLPVLWLAVLCSPHLSINDLLSHLTSLWQQLVIKLKCCQDKHYVEKILVMLNQLLRSILTNVLECGTETLPVEYDDILNIVRLKPSNQFSVQMMDMYLTCPQSSSLLTEECFSEIYNLLEQNLVSSSHSIRLITCHIFSIFPMELPDYDDGLTRESAFKIMYEAEKLVPTVYNYREKLVHLRKLEHDVIIKCLPSKAFNKAPLLFLLGNEFWSFKLLWDPLSDIISSHAHGLDVEEFWEVMLAQLRNAAQAAEMELAGKDPASSDEAESDPARLFISHTSQFLADTRQPNFTSFRLQLWRAMKKFPEKCILRSDDLCTLYLNFLRNEFLAADEDSMSYQNILHCGGVKSQNQSESYCKANVSEMEWQEGADMQQDNIAQYDNDRRNLSFLSVEEEKEKGRKPKRADIQSLLAHLELFASFKKQRAMFHQPHVQNTFYDLLKHRNSSVQQAAFECILTYKNPHILPYRDNFLRLMDDKTFKSEIVLFRVDEESTEVKESDRKELLPVLMRILFGKFHGKAGNDTSGKSRSNLRRSIVFGFLCGCKHEELRYFLELLFQPFMHFVNDDPVKMVRSAQRDMSLEKFIPLKRIKGVLNTVQSVFQKLGHRLSNFSHSLLQILLGLITTVSTALEQRNMVLKGAVNLLKTLHHTALNRITQFFENFEALNYSSKEIEAIFNAVVWPQAQKLALEGIHHPTPLLKLFLFWSQSKRFFPLLGHIKDSTSPRYTPLISIFELLNAPKISPSVEAAIMDLINNLLQSTSEDEDEELLPPLPSQFAPLMEQEKEKAGEYLLSDHISSLISYLRGSLSKVSSNLSTMRQMYMVELKILAKVSSFVTLPKECFELCGLLISFFARGTNLSQDMEENILLSLTNLMQYIDKPETFYRTVSELFYTVERRESRSLLCKLFRVISEKDACLIKIANLIEKLNAWDKNKAEEPDYFVRLEAFSELTALFSSTETVSIDVLLPVIYNCCHFIYQIDDLSIRDNATHSLTSIVSKVASSGSGYNKTFNIVIEKTLVPLVKTGIRHKLERVRHEFLAVLQSLVKSCPNHQMFSGLSELCDKDPEADFFENIRHIQIYKRSRALRRLYKHLKDHHFRSEIHMSYFIPLVYAFIIDQSYSKHANIQDAAIDLLGAICKQLPWQYYLQLLKFYLSSLIRKAELQRQIVRVIVTLLDAFHFDLRNSTYNITFTPEAVAGSSVDNVEGIQTQEEKESEGYGEHNKNILKRNENEEAYIPSFEAAMSTDGMEKTDVTTKIQENIICTAAAATRIHKTVVVSVLPQLHNIITQKAKNEDVHKLAKSKYPEDEEILRVPITLAMIRLLQSLPEGTLENMLPGILLKICTFLRSRSRDVRTTARETLEKAALSLGARFLPFILKELRATLTRGYQLHVLGFTAYRLLKVLSTILKPGDLDPALVTVQEIFYSELFGQIADEKEVDAIKAKYFEAQFIKGYDAYELLAKYISPSCLNSLVQPVKGVLESTYNRRTANKAEAVLVKIAHGLMANSSIPIETMMVFINSLLAQKTNDALVQNRFNAEESDKEKSSSKLPESCLLLPQTAPRGGFKPKHSRKTNSHVLMEFGLQLLNMCLKKSLLLPSEHAHLQLLDPLIPAIKDCLSSSHVKTSANSMRCMSWLLRFPLPSLKQNIAKVAEGMFVVLQNYAGAATAKGGNQELISMCFKAVTVLVRDVTYYTITESQLQVLLTYCEEDLYNYSRQSSAFGLIKAVLSRKLDTPQLHQVIDKLFEMSITASSTSVKLQGRQVILYFLLNYPVGKNLKKHLYFYLDNLNYELEDGRESALEMMISMFSTFPQKILNNHCPKFFVALAMASFNDTSAKCRKLIFVALRTLIGKIDLKRRKTLFADVVSWMKSDVIGVQTMGCHVCGIFVEVEGGKFEFYLKEIIPLLQQQLNPERYTGDVEDSTRTEQEDMCLLALLNTFLKIVKELSIVQRADLTNELNVIWGYVHSYLTYPHSQVRLLSSQLLGLLFSAWEPAEVAQQQPAESQEKSDCETTKLPYILQNTEKLIQNWVKALCQQLQTPNLDDVLGTQVVKNILYLCRLAEAMGRLDILARITKRVMKEANMEVINNIKVTLKRNSVFKWIAAVSVSLNPQSVLSVLPYLLPSLQREILAQTQNEDLKNLAQEVADLLKQQVGVPAFTAAYASCHKWRQEKRDVKRRLATAEAVTNPDIAARKKIRHNLKKKEAVKRKMEEKRPLKRIKKNKLSILNVVVDENDL